MAVAPHVQDQLHDDAPANGRLVYEILDLGLGGFALLVGGEDDSDVRTARQRFGAGAGLLLELQYPGQREGQRIAAGPLPVSGHVRRVIHGVALSTVPGFHAKADQRGDAGACAQHLHDGSPCRCTRFLGRNQSTCRSPS